MKIKKNSDKKLEYHRQWYQENKERILARCKMYRESHQEQRRAYEREYRKTHKKIRDPIKRKESHARWMAKHWPGGWAEYMRWYRKQHPEVAMNSLRRVRYGLSPEDYQARLEEQGSACAICGCLPTSRDHLAVDHNHVTGAIRGLLCRYCNAAIGFLREDLSLTDKIKAYLEHWGARQEQEKEQF